MRNSAPRREIQTCEDSLSVVAHRAKPDKLNGGGTRPSEMASPKCLISGRAKYIVQSPGPQGTVRKGTISLPPSDAVDVIASLLPSPWSLPVVALMFVEWMFPPLVPLDQAESAVAMATLA